MITFFTIPRAFPSAVSKAQERALATWKLAAPDCQVVLCGDDPGVADYARAHGFDHMPALERNHHGTPFLSDAFARIVAMAKFPVICYINTDILLTTSFVETVRRIDLPSYLMIGRRVDTAHAATLDLAKPDWEEQLLRLARENGMKHAATGIDYFCFKNHPSLGKMPRFLIGRYAWDNWILFNAWRLGLPLVDATDSVLILHQDHDYAHMPTKTDRPWLGEEAEYNRSLAELPWGSYFTMEDATHILTPRGIRRRWTWRWLYRVYQWTLIKHPWLGAANRCRKVAQYYAGLPLRKLAKLLRKTPPAA